MSSSSNSDNASNKSSKNPALDEHKERTIEIKKALKSLSAISRASANLGNKQSWRLVFDDKEGGTLDLKKGDISHLVTQTGNAVLDLHPLAKKSAKRVKPPSAKNIELKLLNSDYVQNFVDIVGSDDVDQFSFLRGDDEDLFVSDNLLIKLVNYHIYNKELHAETSANSGKDRKDWNKSNFIVDDVLSAILKDGKGNFAQVGSEVEFITVSSKLDHLTSSVEDALVYPKWVKLSKAELTDIPKEDRPNENDPATHNRLKRYLMNVKDLQKNWTKTHSKDESVAVGELEDQAARSVLTEEGVRVSGRGGEIAGDEDLRKADEILFYTALIDSEAEFGKSLVESVRYK